MVEKGKNEMKYEKLFPVVSLCLFLASCDDNSNSPETVGNFYPNIEACRKDYDIKICEDAFNNAINDLKKNSKKFTDIDICQEEYGYDNCANINSPWEETSDQYPGDVFVPKLQGFSVIVSYETEEDDDGNDVSIPSYGYSGYVYQPFFFYSNYHPYVISSGYGFDNRSSTRSIYISKIDNKTVATTGVKVNNTYVRPNIKSIKTSISRSGFGTRSFSAAKSSLSVSRGGFGSRAASFGGGRGG